VASFSRSGDYTLQLKAFDGEYWSPPDTAVIEINEPSGYLLTVSAGQDKKITQPGRVELYDAEVCADGNILLYFSLIIGHKLTIPRLIVTKK